MSLRHLLLVPLCLGAAPTVVAHAASFDCGAASTPFEKAICGSDTLSRADEVLAKAFATAGGGLTKPASSDLRQGQREWLDFAQRVCTDDAQPMSRGSYDEDGVACLLDAFNARIEALGTSRMVKGHRFVLSSRYDAMPDPNEAENPDSYWKVASHEVTFVLLDGDDPWAKDFNAFMNEEVSQLTSGGEDEEGDSDETSDTQTSYKVEQIAGTARITLSTDSYWYGHGAAHGQYDISYVHYYVPEGRAVQATDIFTGDWQDTFRTAAWDQLKAQHAEWLQLESADDLPDAMFEPSRWDIDDDYGLVVQFEPYEVAAYAYGAPTITIPWETLAEFEAPNQQTLRYGN